jgi:hypothetical protein
MRGRRREGHRHGDAEVAPRPLGAVVSQDAAGTSGGYGGAADWLQLGLAPASSSPAAVAGSQQRDLFADRSGPPLVLHSPPGTSVPPRRSPWRSLLGGGGPREAVQAILVGQRRQEHGLHAGHHGLQRRARVVPRRRELPNYSAFDKIDRKMQPWTTFSIFFLNSVMRCCVRYT